MSGYYAANPHYAPDDFSEERERLERCEAESGRWFDDATKVQKAAFIATMARIAPYKDSPRWERDRCAAIRRWTTSTAGAREVYSMALRDLMLTGEITEATSHAYDALMVDQIVAVVRDDRDAAYADFRRASSMERSSRAGVFA